MLSEKQIEQVVRMLQQPGSPWADRWLERIEETQNQEELEAVLTEMYTDLFNQIAPLVSTIEQQWVRLKEAVQVWASIAPFEAPPGKEDHGDKTT
jgi:hypothetical protein